RSFSALAAWGKSAARWTASRSQVRSWPWAMGDTNCRLARRFAKRSTKKPANELRCSSTSEFLSYCWKLLADVVGQRRVPVVVLGIDSPARKVQHSPSVEL